VATPGEGATASYTDTTATDPNAFYRVSCGTRVRYRAVYIDVTNVWYMGPTNDTFGAMRPRINSATDYAGPDGLLDFNTIAFGGYLRTAGICFLNGALSMAACWKRALSTDEIADYVRNGISPPIIPPTPHVYIITSLPIVVPNDSATLSWTGGKLATNITLNGYDVTAQSKLGFGSTNVPIVVTTNFTICGTWYGNNTICTNVHIICVTNVAPGWWYLDDFDYDTNNSPFGINGQNNWVANIASFGGLVRQPMEVYYAADTPTDHWLSPDGYNALCWQSQVTQHQIPLLGSNTLFFRFYIATNIDDDPPTSGNGDNVEMEIGLTQKTIRDLSEMNTIPYNNGPAIRLYRQGGAGLPIDLYCYNGPSTYQNPPGQQTYQYTQDTNNGDANGLAKGLYYNVWMDIYNTNYYNGGGVTTNGPRYSVYLQREDWPSRTNLVSDFVTDQEPLGASAITTLYVLANDMVTGQGTNMIRVDDFFISTNGFRSDIPRTAGSFLSQ
jgi:hypothetical protein